ncbi:hypothetical protein Fmac_025228 [Flemingia macrophylla]|uniref:Uncharacterized protein n=1 Tax=Flemingia macrophylla TaxID=520843 RepID=A0ABD1LRN5_9FABA
MSNSTTFNISLVDDMNLNPILETLPGRVQNNMREEYHLTPKDGNIQSDVVLLNGTPLQLTKSLDIPEMKPQLVDAYSPIIAKPDSIIFIHTNGFKAPTYDQDMGATSPRKNFGRMTLRIHFLFGEGVKECRDDPLIDAGVAGRESWWLDIKRGLLPPWAPPPLQERRKNGAPFVNGAARPLKMQPLTGLAGSA